ncbi:hypothetical protein ACFWBN_28220 [Streptomyces sp. NPDC059989]|uniref:hypothetical protein n=1 Tax=Streptomyces sp. NPDC059989 TaxID=3347026 RepID=UPI0036957C7C
MRRRLLVTLGAVLLFRLGQNLPVPGVEGVDGVLPGGPGGGLLDLFTGGGLHGPSALALGVLPLYAASVLLAPFPKADRYRRALTLGLGVLGGTVVAVAAAADGTPLLRLVVLAVCVAAGTAVALRLAEVISDRGLGDGPSLLLLTQFAAVFPGQVRAADSGPALVVVPAVGLVVVLAVVTARQAQRRVPVQRAKGMRGRWRHSTDTVHIPIRVDQAGYNPMVWACLLVSVPAWLWWPSALWYLPVAFVAVVLGMYVCALRVLDPGEVARDIERQGGFVPGIRPGPPTAAYLGHVRSRLARCNGLYSGFLVLLPMTALAALGIDADAPLSAPGILAATGVGMIVARAVAQEAETANLMHRYEPVVRQS